MKTTSKQIVQWKLAHLTFSDLLILTPHHLWHDLGKSVGLVGFGIKQALRFFFLRWVWGWLSSFAELYWTWLSFHKKNGVMNVWGLVMLNSLSSWWISSETYQAKKQRWQFWRQSPVVRGSSTSSLPAISSSLHFLLPSWGNTSETRKKEVCHKNWNEKEKLMALFSARHTHMQSPEC